MTDLLRREPVRLYVYGVLAAALPVLVLTGVLEVSDTGDVLALVAAVLGVTGSTEAARQHVSPVSTRR